MRRIVEGVTVNRKTPRVTPVIKVGHGAVIGNIVAGKVVIIVVKRPLSAGEVFSSLG
jgi:hypothetical protein